MTAGTSHRIHLFLDGEYTKSFVYYHELFKGKTFWVMAIAKPGESISDFSIPRCIILPVNFFDIFYCVESEINTK